MKTILPDTVVTLDYTVHTSQDGELLDEGIESIVYIHGGYDAIFPKIEEALEGKTQGESVSVKLSPLDAFGDYDENLVSIAPLGDLPDGEQTTVGTFIEAEDHGDSLLYRVTDIAEGKAILDANHPLAGLSLLFTATVLDIRDATPEEIAAKSPIL